jgi:hypothetical protein
LTAAKFKPLVFSVLGFALPYIADICIFIILYDFCLLAASFCYIIVNVRNIERFMQFSDRCVPWKIASGAENLVLQALQLPQIPRRDKHKSL